MISFYNKKKMLEIEQRNKKEPLKAVRISNDVALKFFYDICHSNVFVRDKKVNLSC